MCGCQQRKFSRKECMLLITVLSTAIIYVYLQYLSTTDHKQSVDEQETTKQSVRIENYDVLLSSYMRSGSTLTGSILGWRNDSFYVYEPLWKKSTWTYWHGNSHVCRADRSDCRLSTGSLVSAMKILKDIYDCQFIDFAKTAFQPNLTDYFGGPSWGQMQACRKHTRNNTLCLHKYIPETCRKAKHRVTKVLRLSTDLLADILRARENLKVIHLFRDPRAIINSRIETEWYPIREEKEIIENAKTLCNKMLYDLKEGQKLLNMFPDRFKIIYYEDFNENPFNKSKEIFKYLGMDLDEHRYPKLRTFSVFSNAKNATQREKNTAFWWRKTLKWGILQKIDYVCMDVNTELGYKCFTNLQEFKNYSLSSVDIPKKYLIV